MEMVDILRRKKEGTLIIFVEVVDEIDTLEKALEILDSRIWWMWKCVEISMEIRMKKLIRIQWKLKKDEEAWDKMGDDASCHKYWTFFSKSSQRVGEITLLIK